MKSEINSVKDDVKMILDNHLPHIAEDVKKVLSVQQDHGAKFVEYDLAKRIVFGAVAAILAGIATVLGVSIKSLLR